MFKCLLFLSTTQEEFQIIKICQKYATVKTFFGRNLLIHRSANKTQMKQKEGRAKNVIAIDNDIYYSRMMTNTQQN